MTKYTYSKAEVNIDRLTLDIHASSIAVALDHIDHVSGTLDIYFKADLSAGEQTTLDNIVVAHTGEPLAVPTTVLIQEEDPDNPTGGHYRACGQSFDVGAGAEVDHDFSYPYPIALLSVTLPTTNLNDGDIANFDVSPETTVGAITQDVTAGDTVINVQQSVIDNLDIGRCLHLDDGVNSERHAVIAIDSAAGTVTIAEGTTNAYAAATPTYCKMSICMAHNIEVVSGTRLELGHSKIGGSYIPANTVIRCRYKNNGGSAVRPRIILEFLY